MNGKGLPPAVGFAPPFAGDIMEMPPRTITKTRAFAIDANQCGRYIRYDLKVVMVTPCPPIYIDRARAPLFLINPHPRCPVGLGR